MMETLTTGSGDRCKGGGLLAASSPRTWMLACSRSTASVRSPSTSKLLRVPATLTLPLGAMASLASPCLGPLHLPKGLRERGGPGPAAKGVRPVDRLTRSRTSTTSHSPATRTSSSRTTRGSVLKRRRVGQACRWADKVQISVL